MVKNDNVFSIRLLGNSSLATIFIDKGLTLCCCLTHDEVEQVSNSCHNGACSDNLFGMDTA
jgi:hypothetical protein